MERNWLSLILVFLLSSMLLVSPLPVHAATVNQPLQITTLPVGTKSDFITVGGCGAIQPGFRADGTVHTFVNLTPNCSLDVFPQGSFTTTSKYCFNTSPHPTCDGSGFAVLTTCASGTCPTYTNTSYFLITENFDFMPLDGSCNSINPPMSFTFQGTIQSLVLTTSPQGQYIDNGTTVSVSTTPIGGCMVVAGTSVFPIRDIDYSGGKTYSFQYQLMSTPLGGTVSGGGGPIGSAPIACVPGYTSINGVCISNGPPSGALNVPTFGNLNNIPQGIYYLTVLFVAVVVIGLIAQNNRNSFGTGRKERSSGANSATRRSSGRGSNGARRSGYSSTARRSSGYGGGTLTGSSRGIAGPRRTHNGS